MIFEKKLHEMVFPSNKNHVIVLTAKKIMLWEIILWKFMLVEVHILAQSKNCFAVP